VDDPSERVAVITGGGRGIGRAISLRLAGAGVAVAIGYRRDEAAARGTCAEIVASGGRAAAYCASVEEPEQVRAMTEQVLSVCRPQDVADMVAFLVSAGASYVNGQRIAVNGGGSSLPDSRY
jgi:NAD(P)-dependent dehydrogenase (short-subunit alcohol dehydrogenase family)